MALIKKQLLAKEDMLLSADNTPVSQARAGTTVAVSPVNASVIPYSSTQSIKDVLDTIGSITDNNFTDIDKAKLDGIAIEANKYIHPSSHPVSIIDGTSNPSKFVKTDTIGNTGFDDIVWADIAGKPSTYTPSAHEHSIDEIISGNLSATRVSITTDRQFITADQLITLANTESLDNKGQPLGYAPLDSQGKINPQYLDSLTILDVFTPADLASMLALVAQPGDVAFRLDTNETYMLIALPASTEANWKQLSNSVGVLSVNGLLGSVSISTDDVPEGAAKYYTDERVDDRVAALLQAGTNITLAYNDTLNTLTINANDTSVNWSEIQSKPTTISGYGITDAYTKTESDAAFSLKANLASPVLTGTPAAPTASAGTNTTQLATTAFVKAEIANDTYSKTELNTSNVFRADKYLATQNIAAMLYTSGNLTKIQYNNATDVNYEILSYTSGNLTNIAHYVSSVLKGNTVLTYTSGALTSAVFTGV